MRTVLNRALAACLAVAALLIAGVPASFAQQQTGSLVLEISDPSGAAIPNAEITLESEKTQTQIRNADARGRARFLLLPPGNYIVEVRAEGYTATRREVLVSLGGTIIEPVTLAKGELTETVEINASPDVDVTETSTSHVYTAEEMQNVQIGSAGRSYLSVLGKAAGVVGGGGNPSVHGATIGENVYLIDGVNTTDPVTGTFGLLTNFDAIEQVELTTGGFQAEYGWATGGYVNQVTKSGTNEIKGTFDGRYYNEKFIDSTAYYENDTDQLFRQLSFTLGGPFKKDKAWWFIAAEDNVTKLGGGTQTLFPGLLPDAQTRTFDGASYLAKVTFQPRPRHRVSFQYSADPAEIDNDNSSQLVAPEAGDFQKQGADFFKGTYWGQLSDKWALSVNAGIYESVLDTYPLNDSGLPAIEEFNTGYLFQNYLDAQYSDRKNKQVSVTLERAWSGERGDHDIKFGVDHQKTELVFERVTPGGELWHTDADLDFDGVVDDPRAFEADNDGDGIPDNVWLIERTVDAGETTNPGKNVAVFLQDTWRRGKMTLDYGLRWEKAQSDRDDGKTVVDTSLIQPRVGMSFDLKGDRKQRLYWSLTRRMHPGILAVPSITNTRNGITTQLYNETYFGFDIDGDGDVASFVPYRSFGGPSSSTVDPDLEATYLDEFIIGWQRSIRTRHSFGSRLVVNKTKNIIEDTFDDPNAGTYIVKNLEGLTRRYEGIELEYTWRHRRGGFFANWTIARARGNVEYTQGLGTDFDALPVHANNRYGYLSTDRRHRIKVYGWVDLPKKFTVAFDLFHGSGAPYNRLRPVGNLDPDEFPGYGYEYMEPRGSRRLPSITTLDADVKKHFLFGSNDDKRLTLIGTIHNVLGANSVTGVQTLDGGSFGQPTARQEPRTYEVGLRFEF